MALVQTNIKRSKWETNLKQCQCKKSFLVELAIIQKQSICQCTVYLQVKKQKEQAVALPVQPWVLYAEINKRVKVYKIIFDIFEIEDKINV